MASKVCDNCNSSGKAPASVPYEQLAEEFAYSDRQIKTRVYKAEKQLFKHI